MKVDTRNIPLEGLTLFEEVSAAEWELNTEELKFIKPLKIKAEVNKSYNALLVKIDIVSAIIISCGRCLEEKEKTFSQNFSLNYALETDKPMLELDNDIREEIILNYPLKMLCSEDCKGLCPKCGANLNKGGCNCGST